MPRTRSTTDADPADLERVAESVRGSFVTVEDLSLSFIREAIMRGVYPPGHRLNLDEVAATLGISRMPVRAGLRQLETEGLLRIHPRRGATVAVLTAAEIAEIYELRILVESFLLERSMAHLTPEFVDELQEIVDGLESSDDPGVRLEQRRAYYDKLYGRAGSPRAVAFVGMLRSSVGRYLALQSVDEHRGHQALVQMLRDNDIDGATTWLTRHLRHVSAELAKIVAADNATATPA